MSTTTEAKDLADKAVPLSPDDLNTVAKFLPSGATLLGGVHTPSRRAATVSDSGSCVIVFYALDDHTIHRAEMCEVGPGHYEIGSDTVVGHW